MQQAYPSGPVEMASANDLASALTLDPAKLQKYLSQILFKKGKHNKARALRAKARIANRKAKRKS